MLGPWVQGACWIEPSLPTSRNTWTRGGLTGRLEEVQREPDDPPLAHRWLLAGHEHAGLAGGRRSADKVRENGTYAVLGNATSGTRIGGLRATGPQLRPARSRFLGCMEFDNIEHLVREMLALTGDFAVSKQLDRGSLSLTITAPVAADNAGARQGRVQARIWTSGAEAFFLELDERFNLKEFDWEVEGQADIIRRMTRLAIAYLQGHGVEGENKGTLGRRRKHFEIELDGETYSFVSNS